jgi:hypothetical protein
MLNHLHFTRYRSTFIVFVLLFSLLTPVRTGAAANQSPAAPVLVQPADNTVGVTYPVSLQVTASDPDAGSLNVTFYGRPVTGSPGADFSLVLLPDSQFESSSYPAVFTSQTSWIVSNKTTRNIVFTTNLGDIVNTSSIIAEYVNADAAYDLLDAGGVSYSVGPGNHDNPTTNYNTYFGVSRFTGKSSYGGNYGSGNDNNVSFFSASGMNFILINLQYNPTAAILDWADALLKANPGRRGILESHSILNVDNSWSNQAVYTALKDNPNLFLMLCGHMHTATDGAAYRAELGDDGHTIHIMQADYQELPNGGNGYLRILRFSPAVNKIFATTYSPYQDASITTSPDQMEMSYAMSGGTSFSVIGTASGVASGSTAAMIWSGLTTGLEYEWFAVASDGSISTPGATWSFTAGSLAKKYRDDYDGDGKTDPVKFIPVTGAAWWLKSTTGVWDGQWLGGDSFTYISASDFDGDGKTDPAKF